MANEEHLAILRQGVEVWNQWRNDNKNEEVNLKGAILRGAYLRQANLERANLEGAILRGAYLSEANLERANLRGANLSEAYLSKAHLTEAHLSQANLERANLEGAILGYIHLSQANLERANLEGAILRGAYLSQANLTGAYLSEANLERANLRGANLRGANLRGTILDKTDLRLATLINTNMHKATLANCRIFGISAWNINLDEAIQSDLIITDEDTAEITVDNLEIAQFVYMLLHNEKLRAVIDTLTTKSVLILGRFTEERKAVLDAIRNELRKRDYVPILFDFEKPANRDLTETVMTLASLARFVIADLSDPHSIPHELMSFAETLLSVPIKPIFCPVPAHPNEYPMLEHLKRYPHVLPVYRYDTAENLIATLRENVIEPAEAKVKEMRP